MIIPLLRTCLTHHLICEMSMSAILILLFLLFAWAMMADRLARWSVTGPLAFALAGMALTRGDDPAVPIELDAHGFQLATEVVLAVLLFTDATESKDYDRSRSSGEWRLLTLALPASIALATLLGALLFPDQGWWLLLVVALVVMPIDLAPISAVLADSRIPLRVRAALNLEAGLNDGLISPVFLFCLANLASAPDASVGSLLWSTAKGAGLALLVGCFWGLAAARLAPLATAKGWTGPETLPFATLALPFLAYSSAVLIDGNGFVAAFVAGVCFAPAAHALGAGTVHLVRDTSHLMAFAVWFVLGALAADQFADGVSWSVLGYAVLVLTVARVLPVLLSLGRLDFSWAERAAIGWLGSRGVTSIVFGVLAATHLDESRGLFVIDVMCTTVLLSIVLHGATLHPVARWFERRTPVSG
ncbi:cation:proton antiporter [Kitasatospora sp. NPDC096147]|uniref:cation:proton antiporter domain-containing protein n=1 Tax=Kitasatospora sp. NPDC096147 TaxID=3364093 RepID=UPI0038152B46